MVGRSHFSVYILKFLSFFFITPIVPLEIISFYLIQKATTPYIGKSPCGHLMAALSFGKA